MTTLTPKEQRERERLHRRWATRKATMKEMDRCRELDRRAAAGQMMGTQPVVHLIRRWNIEDEQPVCGAPHAHHGDRTVYRESVTCPECRVHPAMESALCQDTGKTPMAGDGRAAQALGEVR